MDVRYFRQARTPGKVARSGRIRLPPVEAKRSSGGPTVNPSGASPDGVFLRSPRSGEPLDPVVKSVRPPGAGAVAAG